MTVLASPTATQLFVVGQLIDERAFPCGSGFCQDHCVLPL
jgi:hypothetical protein